MSEKILFRNIPLSLSPSPSLSLRSKLTAGAEKESIAMFVRNLRQRLLVCPVRGRVLLGVDPGFRHGCKLAVLSPTSKNSAGAGTPTQPFTSRARFNR